jgi:hypothetical protein
VGEEVGLIVRVDGELVAPAELWWPAMNFGQSRRDAPAGEYEIELPRSEFVSRLRTVYLQRVAELRVDDLLVPEEASRIGLAGYPPLELLPDHPDALLEAVQVYLAPDLFMAFLPGPPTGARFMVNSVDSVASTPTVVVLRGGGYHGEPGFARPTATPLDPDR